MTRWTNFVGYQLVWFAAVWGASRGWTWPAVLAVAVFAAWQLAVSAQRAADARLAGVAMLTGVVLDGVFSATGVLHYAAGAPALPPGGAPLWILALWVAFALTFNHSLRWLAGRPLLCLALGAAGGPLAYAAAARLGAVSFLAPVWLGVLCLAVGWAVACTVLGSLAAAWRGRTWTHTPVSS
jgi:Protein of unknown function (DUF2878)